MKPTFQHFKKPTQTKTEVPSSLPSLIFAYSNHYTLFKLSSSLSLFNWTCTYEQTRIRRENYIKANGESNKIKPTEEVSEILVLARQSIIALCQNRHRLSPGGESETRRPGGQPKLVQLKISLAIWISWFTPKVGKLQTSHS